MGTRPNLQLLPASEHNGSEPMHKFQVKENADYQSTVLQHPAEHGRWHNTMPSTALALQV